MSDPSDLEQALTRYRTAKPALKAAFRESATAVALEFAAERDGLVARLEGRWRWCDGNGGHPAHREREDAVLADLAVYERTEDALREAARALFGEAA